MSLLLETYRNAQDHELMYGEHTRFMEVFWALPEDEQDIVSEEFLLAHELAKDNEIPYDQMFEWAEPFIVEATWPRYAMA